MWWLPAPEVTGSLCGSLRIRQASIQIVGFPYYIESSPLEQNSLCPLDYQPYGLGRRLVRKRRPRLSQVLLRIRREARRTDRVTRETTPLQC